MVNARAMVAADLERIGELSSQLGYRVPFDALVTRYRHIAADPAQALFVAERANRVIGWIHAHPRWLLESEPYAEIGGLVVDEAVRRSGAGRALIGSVERWARERGFKTIRVRANVTRPEAHEFYPAVGFERLKTQHTYELRVN